MLRALLISLTVLLLATPAFAGSAGQDKSRPSVVDYESNRP